MPRSIHQIISEAMAQELADRFEGTDPDGWDEGDVPDDLLERAARARSRSERELAEAVVCRAAGPAVTRRIGQLVGTSAQAAQQRYGSLVTS